MASAEPRKIDWANAEIEEGALTVELTGANSKAWRRRFESVLTLLETSHSQWGEVRINRNAIRVAEVGQGSETELRHFLESVVLQVNSELPQPKESTQGDEADVVETKADEAAHVDRQMTAAFRAFAEQ
jgi:hypothetical protein